MLIFPQRIECSVVGKEKETKTIMKEKPQCVSGWEGTGGLYKHFPSLLTPMSFASLTAPKKFAIRVLLRTLITQFSARSSTTSPRAHKPENSHIALLTSLEAHDAGIYFLCVPVGVWLKMSKVAGADCHEAEGCDSGSRALVIVLS